MLYIVSTPIGNLKDISLRALEILKSVHLIAAEDTRHTRKLLSHYDIHTPLTSYFEHNKVTKGPYLIKLLKQGKDIALVSDSGTPGISDPGFSIIHLTLKNNIPLTTVPGPSALIAALVLSGKPSHRFAFEGFLPPKQNARKRRLRALLSEERTTIIYESPHRLVKTLKDVEEVFGAREIVVARELTKKFEELKHGQAGEFVRHFSDNKPRGEFIIVL